MRKTYKGDWYDVNSLFGNDWAIFYYLLGGRGVGKSYSVMKWATRRKFKKGEKCKFYWMRLDDSSAKVLLENGGDKLVDPDLKRKFNLKTLRKGSTVYTYSERETTTKNGEVKKIKEDIKEFCTVLSCATFYQSKGVGYYDSEYDGEYIFVLDEFEREESQRNTFDILYNFTNLLENVARFTKSKIKVIMIGNTLEEASDLLTAMNFIPNEFGRYKLKKKKAIIDYIESNEAHKKRREGTVADILMGNASTFTNEIILDSSMLVNKRKAHTPQYIIKFSKDKSKWFTVYNDNIIKPWNKEEKTAVAMKRYLDNIYNQEMVNVVLQRFDVMAYKFVSMACFKEFQKQMKLLKKT